MAHQPMPDNKGWSIIQPTNIKSASTAAQQPYAIYCNNEHIMCIKRYRSGQRQNNNSIIIAVHLPNHNYIRRDLSQPNGARWRIPRPIIT